MMIVDGIHLYILLRPFIPNYTDQQPIMARRCTIVFCVSLERNTRHHQLRLLKGEGGER